MGTKRANAQAGLKANRWRALELLASSHDGCTEAIMIAHGFTVAQMVELVRAGLATPTPERVRAGRQVLEVARVRITEAGRRALAQSTQTMGGRKPAEYRELRQQYKPESISLVARFNQFERI
jgi:hypothetical protein